MGGNKSNCYISPKQAGQMHRSLALTSARRFVEQAKSDIPLVLDNNQIWDFDIRLYRDVILQSGTALTISCRVIMPFGGKLIVSPGATLIVDGGIITTEDDLFWHGIEVHGDAGQHQYEIGGMSAQGKLILKNGAVIKNALIGAFLGGYGANGKEDPQKAGGIVQVIGNSSLTEPSASFVNNLKAVRFIPYQNYNPNNAGDIKPNRSYFHNALFEINSNYIGTSNWSFNHVELFGVNGVSFKGCTFTNKQEYGKGRGIYCAPGPGKSADCGFSVSAICTSQMSPCPEQSWDRCEFRNLAHGIEAFYTGTGAFTVEDATFVNNSYGIKMAGVNNAAILFSEFYIGEATGTDMDGCGTLSSGYGIFMDNCTGFAIEENYFSKASGAPQGNYTGIYIAETHAADQVLKIPSMA